VLCLISVWATLQPGAMLPSFDGLVLFLMLHPLTSEASVPFQCFTLTTLLTGVFVAENDLFGTPSHRRVHCLVGPSSGGKCPSHLRLNRFRFQGSLFDLLPSS